LTQVIVLQIGDAERTAEVFAAGRVHLDESGLRVAVVREVDAVAQHAGRRQADGACEHDRRSEGK
jgi:hypothetical protein